MGDTRAFFLATVKKVEPKHDPPSPADCAERWLGVRYYGGDREFYERATLEVLARTAQALRKWEGGDE